MKWNVLTLLLFAVMNVKKKKAWKNCTKNIRETAKPWEMNRVIVRVHCSLMKKIINSANTVKHYLGHLQRSLVFLNANFGERQEGEAIKHGTALLFWECHLFCLHFILLLGLWFRVKGLISCFCRSGIGYYSPKDSSGVLLRV